MSSHYEFQGASAGYRLNRADAVLRGRWKELVGTIVVALLLFALQWPMRLVAGGTLTSVGPSVDAADAARLSLLVDAAFIVAYVFVAFRVFGLIRNLCPPRPVLRVGMIATGIVGVGAVLDVIEDVLLWIADGDLTNGLTWFMRGFVGAGLVVELVALNRAYRRRGDRDAGPAEPAASVGAAEPASTPPAPTGIGAVVARAWSWLLGLLGLKDDESPAPRVPPGPLGEPEGTIICCSGGGIRSAAFSLGGLQELTEDGIYQDASHVVGVSGGGYIGAAHHVLRWRSADGDGTWPDLSTEPPFAPSSPELQWLRRHTRYVLNSASVFTRAALSLAFGIAVNLLLLAIALGGATWLLGWVWLASGRIGEVTWRRAPADQVAAMVGGTWTYDVDRALAARFDLSYGSGWSWVGWVWVIPAVGVLLFLVEKAVNRYWTPGRRFSSGVRGGTTVFLWGGGFATALVLGVPWMLEMLNRFAATSGTPLASLVRQLGLVPDQLCQMAIEHGERVGCGVESAERLGTTGTSALGATSLITIVGSVLAVLGSLRAAGGGTSEGATWVGSLLAKVWAKVKSSVIPWLAAVTIVVVLVVLLLRWVASLTVDPSQLDDWQLAYGFGGALVACFVFTEPNRTSMHHFFRERISYAFLVRRGGGRIRPVDYRVPLRFSRSSPPEGRGPELVACAVANVSDEELVPSKRDCTPFIFDSERIGLADRLVPEDAGRRSSAAYEFAADHHYRDATIPAAIAMSAAAFSPLAGRENVRLGPYRAVLALANARLGVWLPNPLWIDEKSIARRLARLGRDAEGRKIEAPQPCKAFWWAAETIRNTFKKPGFARLAKEAFGRTSVYDRYLYITDGGHYDNLGLIEALRRRPATIYVIDASNDAEDTFNALGKAIASARMDLECEVDVDPRGMRRLELEHAPSAWCVGTATYADGQTAKILISKAIMLDGLSWDVATYQGSNPDFPRTSTNNQLYSEFDFEAYRSLGGQTMRKLLLSQQDD